MPIQLTVTAGPHAGRRFSFDRHDMFLVGRAPEAHFSLPDDDYFSRMHCLIEVNPPHCRLTDLGSRNGTFVNDNRVQTADLKHGDEVRGGLTVLKVAIAAIAPNVTVDLPAAPAEQGLSTVGPEPSGQALPAIPGHRLLGPLGMGAMGTVYLAVRNSDQAEVAVKTIREEDGEDSPAVARFLREASIMERLRHPNIVACYGSGTTGRLVYFVMEYVEGSDAARLLQRDGPLPIRRAVRLTLQVLLGLDHAHRQGFVHRDIKPANLLVTQPAGRELVKVADFGLARAYQDSALSGLTMTGTMAGTPAFMSPEQITDFRNVKPAADQYATAVTLYHLLTGRYPHEAKTMPDVLRKVLTEEPVPLRQRRPEAPARLAAVVQRGTARRPEERFADVRAMAQALAPFG